VVETDGAGVLYNRGFSIDAGIAGPIWTIAGASMEFDPDTLNLRSRGRYVAVTIEGENNRATEINDATLALTVDGAAGNVPELLHTLAETVDADGDNNVDLKLKFDRPALIALLDRISGSTAIVRASWLYNDGTEGSAAVQVRVIR